MNSDQAKALNMVDVMSRLGFEPVVTRKNGTEYHYLSPFRAEMHPSFVVGQGKVVKWVWNDFGDRGGTVIDFIMRLNNYSQVNQALSFLDALYQGTIPRAANNNKRVGENQLTFSFSQQNRAAVENFSKSVETEFQLELLEAKEIQNKLIHFYLTSKRGIPSDLANRYLVEVKYRHVKTGREYFAIGLKNESGGYDIRVASDDYDFTKSCLGKKDITIIPGSAPGGAVNIFEGGLDCLSAMAIYNSDHLIGDSIILNTTQNFAKAAEVIRKNSYRTINTFLDNDRAGEECLQQFREFFGELVKPQNSLYQNFNDVNEALVDTLDSHKARIK